MNEEDYVQKLEEANKLLEIQMVQDKIAFDKQAEFLRESHRDESDEYRAMYEKNRIKIKYLLADFESILKRYGSTAVAPELTRIHTKIKELEKQFFKAGPFDE